MLAFVGESGSGKTTTARAIIGLLANMPDATAGRVEINGEDISGWSGKRDLIVAARHAYQSGPAGPGNS
ncbi:hypothetical protein DMH17_13125 [Raoultella planticola]|nr:hypothetical protein [Raoultella planticola]